MTNLDRSKLQSVGSFIVDGDFLIAEINSLSQGADGRIVGEKSVLCCDLIKKQYKNIKDDDWSALPKE